MPVFINLAIRSALLLSFGILYASGPKDKKELAANDSYKLSLSHSQQNQHVMA